MKITEKNIVLIPAYQPQEELLHTVRELASLDFFVIVVNDGSGPASEEIFRETERFARVLEHPENRGKGAALKTGLSYIKEHFEPGYTVVTADADGQHRIADILNVCEEARRYPNCLILGSRRFDKDVPLRSRLGNTITRFVFRASSGVALYDTQTGLRAFGDCLIDRMLAVGGDRYEYEMNVLMELTRDKTMVREVWIETVYLNGNASSHFDTVRDSYRIYREILKFSFSSLVSFCVDYLLFCAFSVSSGTLVLSNVLARICSGTLNYTMNKRFVFGQRGDVARCAAKYLMLAGFLLFCNTTVLKLLAASGVNRYAAKILTELVLFLFSWSVQHRIIFRREGVSE